MNTVWIWYWGLCALSLFDGFATVFEMRKVGYNLEANPVLWNLITELDNPWMIVALKTLMLLALGLGLSKMAGNMARWGFVLRSLCVVFGVLATYHVFLLIRFHESLF